MSNKLALALIEFCKKDNPPSGELAKKYGISKAELWAGYVQITAKDRKWKS
jgi:hypothetical protein